MLLHKNDNIDAVTLVVVVNEYNVRISSGTVGSDLTDFPVMISMEDFPVSFWSQVDPDGGNIRAYDSTGNVAIPLDVTDVQLDQNRGRMYVKQTISALLDTDIVIKLDGNGLAANNSVIGRDAVWSDYVYSFVFPSKDNRTGVNLTTNFTNMEDHTYWIKQSFGRLTGNPHQGVATDGTNFWSVDTNAIRRMNMSYAVLNSETNITAHVIASGGPDIDHLGDPVVVGNRLFTTATHARTGGGNYHRYIFEFDATTLAFVTSTEIGDEVTNNHEFGATVCFDGTYLVLFSYTDGTKFRRYTLDGVYVDETAMSQTINDIQGSTYMPWGNFYVSEDNLSNLYEVTPQGQVLGVVYHDAHGSIVEGIEYDETTGLLHVLKGDGDMGSFLMDTRRSDYVKLHYQTSSITHPRSDVWTMGASWYWTITSGDLQHTIWGIDGSFLMYDEGPDDIGMWNNQDSWLHSTVNPSGYSEHRIGASHDGTTDRRVFVNGNVWTDNGVNIRPDVGVDPVTSFLNTTDSEAYYQSVWFRDEKMSSDWMAADAMNMNTPTSFYTITQI